jgi:hypothetical protein
MRMNAAAQAWSFNVLSGASEYVKIVNGSVDIACRGSVTTALRKIDVVKSRLMRNYGYCEICSTDVLSFVASIFARGHSKK